MATYRFLFSPRWLAFHALVVLGIVSFIGFGLWQLDRLEQRRDFNRAVSARIDEPPLTLAQLQERISAGTPIDELEWFTVDASGRFLADEQLLVVNRSQGGRAGDNVVTPLLLDDGSILLVNRGFVPLGEPIPDAASGPVNVNGTVRPSEQRGRGQLSDPAEGELREVQRIDIDRLEAQLPGDLLPVYVDLRTSQPPAPGPFPEPLRRPELSEGPHLSYAVQWFIFSTAVAVGWVLAVRHSLTRRRLDAMTPGSSPADRPPTTNDAPTTAHPGTSSPSSS